MGGNPEYELDEQAKTGNNKQSNHLTDQRSDSLIVYEVKFRQ